MAPARVGLDAASFTAVPASFTAADPVAVTPPAAAPTTPLELVGDAVVATTGTVAEVSLPCDDDELRLVDGTVAVDVFAESEDFEATAISRPPPGVPVIVATVGRALVVVDAPLPDPLSAANVARLGLVLDDTDAGWASTVPVEAVGAVTVGLPVDATVCVAAVFMVRVAAVLLLSCAAVVPPLARTG